MMEIVCESCGGRGAPGQVWQSESGVGLECAACGHINKVGGSPEGEAEPDPPAEVAEARAPREVEPDVERHQCAKCGWRQATAEACHRCGFLFSNYRPGEMAWEQVPVEQEAAWERAEALWEAVERDPGRVTYEQFMNHCLASDLEDLAARKLRFAVADHPGDMLAREHLQTMVERGRARLAAQLSMDRDASTEQVKRLRQGLTIVVLILALLLSFYFFSSYPGLLPW